MFVLDLSNQLDPNHPIDLIFGLAELIFELVDNIYLVLFTPLNQLASLIPGIPQWLANYLNLATSESFLGGLFGHLSLVAIMTSGVIAFVVITFIKWILDGFGL